LSRLPGLPLPQAFAIPRPWIILYFPNPYRCHDSTANTKTTSVESRNCARYVPPILVHICSKCLCLKSNKRARLLGHDPRVIQRAEKPRSRCAVSYNTYTYMHQISLRAYNACKYMHKKLTLLPYWPGYQRIGVLSHTQLHP
jgi:hypothetical protein